MTINIYKTQKLVKQTLYKHIKLAQDRRTNFYIFFVLRHFVGVSTIEIIEEVQRSAEFFRCIINLLMFNEFVYRYKIAKPFQIKRTGGIVVEIEFCQWSPVARKSIRDSSLVAKTVCPIRKPIRRFSLVVNVVWPMRGLEI